jgi:hypothetical protein
MPRQTSYNSSWVDGWSLRSKEENEALMNRLLHVPACCSHDVARPSEARPGPARPCC